jgi:hypothetical protein
MATADSQSVRRTHSWRAVVAIALCALVPALASLAMTRSGPGLTVDGSEYLAIAEQFRDHGALAMPYQSYDEPYQVPVRLHPSVPQTQFPPAWSILVGSLSKVTGAPPMTVARWLDAVFLWALAAAFGALVLRSTRSTWIAAGAAALLAMPDVLIAHAQVWSEPLTLLTMMGVLIGVERRTGGDERRRWLALILGALFVGVLARYVAIGFGLAAVIAVWRARPTISTRARDVALMAAACAIPLAAWTAHTAARIGRASERTFRVHPPHLRDFRDGYDTVTRWIAGGLPHRALLVPLALLVVAALAWRARRPDEPGFDPVHRLVATFVGCYLLTVLAARTLVDANIPFDGRILLPLYLLGLLAVSCRLGRPDARRVAVVSLVVAALVLGVRDVDLVRRFPTAEVAGYRSTRWAKSPTIAYLRGLDPDTVVVTNSPDAVRFLVGHRTTLFTPLELNLYTDTRNSRYDEELRSLARAVDGRPTVLVHFFRPTRSKRRPINPLLTEALGMRLDRELADGQIYVRAG